MRTPQLHLQKSTEALLGYLQGIACDDQLTDSEIANLQRWLQTHHALRGNYPFDEISDRLESILRDAVIDEDERAELLEWCADLSLDTHPVYDLIDMATRQLHGVLHGIQSLPITQWVGSSINTRARAVFALSLNTFCRSRNWKVEY